MHTPEMAVMDGVVLEAGPASGFGLAVYIQHENGDVTVYGHMDEILVEAGQVVRAGDTIALLGNRGQSTGPHLHFEVHVGGLNGAEDRPAAVAARARRRDLSRPPALIDAPHRKLPAGGVGRGAHFSTSRYDAREAGDGTRSQPRPGHRRRRRTGAGWSSSSA